MNYMTYFAKISLRIAAHFPVMESGYCLMFWLDFRIYGLNCWAISLTETHGVYWGHNLVILVVSSIPMTSFVSIVQKLLTKKMSKQKLMPGWFSCHHFTHPPYKKNSFFVSGCFSKYRTRVFKASNHPHQIPNSQTVEVHSKCLDRKSFKSPPTSSYLKINSNQQLQRAAYNVKYLDHPQSHRIHVWDIYLHLVDVYGKRRQIYQSHGSYGNVPLKKGASRCYGKKTHTKKNKNDIHWPPHQCPC